MSEPSPSSLATVRPITSTPSLAQFQRFLLGQIEQLQKSSLSRKSTSHVVVAAQDSYGALKESIINYYCQQRAARKFKDTGQIATEVAELKSAHIFMKNCIQDLIGEFYSYFRMNLEEINRDMMRLEDENIRLKAKLMDMGKAQRALSEQNQKLRRDLEEWEQAKIRRRMKQQRKDEPSVEKIQQIIQNKLVKEDLLSNMTPLKQFNMQNFINKKIPAFNFATSMAENKSVAHIEKKFRTSSISDFKNFNQFSTNLDIREDLDRQNPQRRRSKQKLKVVSIDS